MTRPIKQIVGFAASVSTDGCIDRLRAAERLVALCEDGTLWVSTDWGTSWSAVMGPPSAGGAEPGVRA